MDRISLNFVYAFILIISRLGLLPVIFCSFVTELWPLIDVRIYFLLNIFRIWPFYCMKSAADSVTILVGLDKPIFGLFESGRYRQVLL